MTSKGILYLIISGTKDYRRAMEALRLAEYQAGDGRNVALMLQGEGVEWLEKGDEVMTTGGIIGKISKIKEDYVVLSLAEGMEIKFQKASIAQTLPKGTIKSIED